MHIKFVNTFSYKYTLTILLSLLITLSPGQLTAKDTKIEKFQNNNQRL